MVIGFVGCVGLLLGRLRPHYLRVGGVSCHCFMLEVVLSLSFFLGGLGLARECSPYYHNCFVGHAGVVTGPRAEGRVV
jgi:hypothetical protein